VLQEGRNAGVTGVLDLPASGIKFSVWARAWNSDLTAQMLDAAGRGDTEWPEQRPGSTNGVIVVSGSVTLDGFPVPTKFRGELGTLTLTLNTGVTATHSVRVQKASFKKNDKQQGLWDATYFCVDVSEPTFAGFGGTQATAATETFSDKILWAGLSTTVDPQNLQSGATRRVLIWGTSDNDSAEKTKIDQVLAALSAPFASLKLRPGTFSRASKNACYFDAVWGLTDTKDDVLLPRNTRIDDPTQLLSVAQTAAINAPAPAPPPGSLAFVPRTTQTVRLHDNATLNTADYGLLTPQQDREFPGTYRVTDPSDLASTWSQVSDWNWETQSMPPAIIPAGQRLRGTKIVNVNQVKKEVHYTGGKDSTKEEVEQTNSFTFVDPHGLESEQFVAKVDNNNPALTAGFVDRGIKTSLVTHDHPLYQRRGGLRTTKEDREFPNTFARLDPKGLDSEAKTTTVFDGQGNGPPDPAAPSAELQVVFRKTNRENQLKSIQEITWDVLDSEQKRGFPKVRTVDDAQNIKDLAVRYKFFNHGQQIPSAPDDPPTNNVKLIHTEVLRESPARSMALFVYGAKNSRDELVLDHYETTTDSSGLATNAIRAYLDGESVPTTPAGQKLRDTKVIPITDGLTTNRTLTILFYGLTTREDDEEMGATEYVVDASGNIVSGSAVVTVLESDSTPDGGVSVSGLVLRDTKKKQRNDNKWAISYIFGQSTHEDDIEFAGTELIDCKSNLTGSAEVTIINNSSSTYPTALDTPPSISGETMQLMRVKRKQITSGSASGMYAWTGVYSANTPEQEVTFDQTISVYSPLDFYKNKTATVVATGGSSMDALSAAALTANQSDVTFESVAHKQLTPAKALKIIEATGADKVIHSASGHVTEDVVKGRPPASLMTGDLNTPLAAAWNTQQAVVMVSRTAVVVGGPGGGTEALVEPLKVFRMRGSFRYRRRFIVANLAAVAAKMQQGSIGSSNSSSFLGWPAHWCMYHFPDIQYTQAVSGGHLLVIDYVFGVDSWMWMSDKHLSDGRLSIYNLGNPVPGPGFWDPAVYFHPSAPMGRLAWSPEADFSIFDA